MNVRQTLNRLAHLLGVERQSVSHQEKLISALGGVAGILVVFLVSRQALGEGQGLLVAASMGASAVLLFAVPHGALSQPWPLLAGHLVSAAIGVTCARLLPDPLLAVGVPGTALVNNPLINGKVEQIPLF